MIHQINLVKKKVWCYREIYPGLQIALDQRVAYYGSKGLPVPKFPDKIDTVRCIYGYVDAGSPYFFLRKII